MPYYFHPYNHLILCPFSHFNDNFRRFDRAGLGGTHSVRDEEVLAVEDAETVPLTSFMQSLVRPRPQPPPQPQPFSSIFASPVKGTTGGGGGSGVSVGGIGTHNLSGINFSPQLANDPLLSGSTPRGKVRL